MRIENRGSMKILTPKFGYELHNIHTDVYSEKVYLNKKGKVEDYEEVLKKGISLELCEKIEGFEKTNNELNAAKEKLELENKKLRSTINELELINDEQDNMIVELFTELAILNLII